ncbi:MAG: 16S rRNA (cytidine(1402)-2'-O)-methyltransferase [Acidobacteriota bacterium]
MPGFPAGALFLVATPIGNLGDITLRALQVLRAVDIVAAEDTRHTARLLAHYGISVPTTSLHEHNEAAKAASLVRRLQAGGRIAVVSDAGTPGISDPGFRVVRAALEAGCRVEAIPGPSAVVAALVSSGLPTDAFVFMGFPPARGSARAAWFDRLRHEERTVVFFEAPHRVRRTLEQALEAGISREGALCRELTKVHEETLRGPLAELVTRLPARPIGEFTVVLAGDRNLPPDGPAVPPDRLYGEFCQMTENGASRRDAITTLARRYKLRSREVYAAIEQMRDS